MNNEIIFRSLSKIVDNYSNKYTNQRKSWVGGYIRNVLGRSTNKSGYDMLN